MYAQNIKIDFLSPFNKTLKDRDLKKIITIPTSTHLFLNYFENFENNPKIKREIGLPLLHEGKNLLNMLVLDKKKEQQEKEKYSRKHIFIIFLYFSFMI